MSIVVTIETFDLGKVLLHILNQWLFAHWLFFVTWRPRLSLAPLVFIAALASITWANLVLLGDSASDFTLRACKGFIHHAFHHLHQALTNTWNINPLINYLVHLELQPMQEDQLPSIPIFEGDYNQHLIKVLNVGGQWAPIIPLGELQKLHHIPKH